MSNYPYTERDRAAALAALEANNGNVTRTAKQLNMSRATLTRWRDQHNDPTNTGRLKKGAAQTLPEARASLAERLQEFAHAVLDIAPDKLNNANLQHAFTALGISLDKAQLLQGQPTEITKNETHNIETPERALQAAATALERRGYTN